MKNDRKSILALGFCRCGFYPCESVLIRGSSSFLPVQPWTVGLAVSVQANKVSRLPPESRRAKKDIAKIDNC